MPRHCTSPTWRCVWRLGDWQATWSGRLFLVVRLLIVDAFSPLSCSSSLGSLGESAVSRLIYSLWFVENMECFPYLPPWPPFFFLPVLIVLGHGRKALGVDGHQFPPTVASVCSLFQKLITNHVQQTTQLSNVKYTYIIYIFLGLLILTELLYLESFSNFVKSKCS